MSENLLGRETSPYLLQHKNNPVHWQPWGTGAMAQAKRANKPILLSVGYAACHWCHVMAHESFEDAQIANIMNGLFVNVKVDREERPDIDELYMSALHMMRERGGWPLTMFLTPAGAPFWGGTYFPKTAKYGRPGFPDVLKEISRMFHEEADKVNSNAKQLTDALNKHAQISTKGSIADDLPQKAAQTLAQHIDKQRGGVAGAPKFPQIPLFQFIWQNGYWGKQEDLSALIHTTAQHMAHGGLYDHLGGGFARYSVDADWIVPHFEKMLYDNAQLLELYARLWRETSAPLYKDRIEKTISWLAREMTHEQGGFFSSLDADSEGEEGLFYVWSKSEIETHLNAQNLEADSFCAAYGVTDSGNFEGHNNLNTLSSLSFEVEQKFSAARETLFDLREKRIHPDCDDKILTDWNGLMISALADLAALFNRRDWLEMAERAFDFILTHMSRKENSLLKLSHSWREGITKPMALAEDYANLMAAALNLFSATGKQDYLTKAIALDKTLSADFSSDVLGKEEGEPQEGLGGYFMNAHTAEDVPAPVRSAKDGALPNANGTMVWVLARLHAFTGKLDYRERSDTLAESFALPMDTQFSEMTTLMGHYQKLEKMRHCVLVGKASSDSYKQMLEILTSHPDPALIIQPCHTITELDTSHPVFGKEAIKGETTVYICQQQSCLPPITTPEDLKEQLGV